jgi:Zn-dependent oligopeptidase
MAQHKTTVIRFLNELTSKEVKGTFEFLENILKELEDKIDPDPIEMEIVDSAYQAIEKLNMLENNLRRYVTIENNSLPGNKLNDLYESGTIVKPF